MTSSKVRVRFAPSPTGYLHIGGARTALFNYLFARHHGGTFVLRVEDTDKERSTEESVHEITESMKWLGLDWDEGPFFQSRRYAIYREYADKLVTTGHAYRCTCPADQLAAEREAAQKAGKTYRYPGYCREKNIPADCGLPFVVRFKMPTDGQTVVHDLIKGDVTFENAELDDLVIVRTGGDPIYNFVVVVDDMLMEISHVIRGDDHLNNTPKQIRMYEAFGASVPIFAHIPLILGADRSRLSKRHGATAVLAYRDMGYLPEAVVNFIARIGWACGDEEIFTHAGLIEKFSLENVSKSAGVFNPEKLDWLNAQYMQSADPRYLFDIAKPFIAAKGIADPQWSETAGLLVTELKPRAKTIIELADGMLFFFRDTVEYDPAAKTKFINDVSKAHLKIIAKRLGELTDFTRSGIGEVINGYVAENSLKLGAVAQPIRVALTGKTISPGVFEVMEILGKDRTLARIDAVL